MSAGIIGHDAIQRQERMRRRVLGKYWHWLGWRVRVRLYRVSGCSLASALFRATF